MFEEKTVIVIRELGMFEEEFHFNADSFPMAKYFACKWAKNKGYELIKSPAKIAQTFCPYRTPVNKNQIIWYAI